MNQEPANILIVDDDSSNRSALRTVLARLGFQVAEALRGEEALALVRTTQFNAVLLDINMPGIGGIETCRRIRSIKPKVPVLMLTVRNREEDIVEALETGADDYITKPFHVRELIARLHTAVRRSQLDEAAKCTSVRVGEIELDTERHIVLKAGIPVHLTPKEFDLLYYMMSNAGVLIQHAQLLGSVWGPEYGDEVEYLRTFVRQLRKKLEDDPAKPRYLLTEAYVGYRFAEPTSFLVHE
ncbi:MAG: response regulator transcription factor [Acidobacteriaceae bacterium]|nr:response regulator transcription factor [Nitrososphaerota archaeon]